jgi:hypothetical protein
MHVGMCAFFQNLDGRHTDREVYRARHPGPHENGRIVYRVHNAAHPRSHATSRFVERIV